MAAPFAAGIAQANSSSVASGVAFFATLTLSDATAAGAVACVVNSMVIES